MTSRIFPSSDRPSCSNCRYFRRYEDTMDIDEAGECHRYAPKPGLSVIHTASVPCANHCDAEVNAHNVGAVWPLVMTGDWCGEYEQG